MSEDLIGYPAILDGAMRGVARAALQKVAENGLPGEHHFYITFRTDFPGVEMPKVLRAQYPQEMTIVLQHRFWDLVVDEDLFSVSLTFSGNPANLVLPFKSLTAFADPGANVGLQFQGNDNNELAAGLVAGQDFNVGDSASGPQAKMNLDAPKDLDTPEAEEDDQPGEDATVVSIDAFRRR